MQQSSYTRATDASPALRIYDWVQNRSNMTRKFCNLVVFCATVFSLVSTTHSKGSYFSQSQGRCWKNTFLLDDCFGLLCCAETRAAC